MEFVEAMKIIRKICTINTDDCISCQLYEKCVFGDLPYKWKDFEIDCAISCAEKWNEAHEPKTWLKVLLERLPNMELNDGIPSLCPFEFFGGNAPANVGLECFRKCRECWNSIAPDEFQDKE